MDCHLVPIEIRIVCNAHQWMELNGLTFNEYGLKGLNTQTVQGGSTIQQNRMFPYNFIKGIPYLRGLLFHHLLRTLDSGNKTLFFELIVNKGLKELYCHPLWQTALMKPEFRTYYNDRTS